MTAGPRYGMDLIVHARQGGDKGMTVYHGDAGELVTRLRKCGWPSESAVEMCREAADGIEAQRAELMNTKRIASAAKWFATYIQVDATMSGPVVTGVARGAKDEHGVGVNRAWSVLCAAFTKYDEESKK